MTALTTLIARRFPPPEFVLFFEVEGMAQGRSRFADAVAFGIWPSRGLALHGFEVKNDRRDWLRELRDPSKAEAVMQHCDRWWLVTSENVAKLEEIPEQWGWLEAKGGKLFQRKDAPKQVRSATIQRHFAASLLRRVNDTTVPKPVVQQMIEERVEAMRASIERQQVPAGAREMVAELDRLRKVVADFERASGIQLHQWGDGENIAKDVALAMRIRTEKSTLRMWLQTYAHSLAREQKHMKDLAAELDGD